MWAIVDTDNFGGDYPDERFVGQPFALKKDAEQEAKRLNHTYDWAPRYKKVVRLPYKLQPGLEP